MLSVVACYSLFVVGVICCSSLFLLHVCGCVLLLRIVVVILFVAGYSLVYVFVMCVLCVVVRCLLYFLFIVY